MYTTYGFNAYWTYNQLTKLSKENAKLAELVEPNN